MNNEKLVNKFSLEEPSKFDLNTYIGRVKHFAKITDIRLIFLTRSNLENYNEILENFRKKPQEYDLTNPNVNNTLWDARYGIRSAINSETGSVIPIYARMCAMLPINIPIAFGLFVLPATKTNIFIFNTINQSYNALMNFMNGSGSGDSVKYALISFGLAVTSSVATGFYLKNKFSKQKTTNIFKEAMLRIIPSSIAGFLNLFIMRSDYFTKGINVRTENEKILGSSKICGAKAVLEGALSRLCLPIPLLMNFFLLKGINKLNLPKNINILVELSLLGVALLAGLTLSIAIFKEKGKIKARSLETEIQDAAKQENCEYVFYNKGL